MFASIMDGMKAQRERSTTNRREAAKLFNEHLKNQSELGIEVTEQSLSDAWDANSGGVLRKHAPTQQRLQSIVAAQNKSLAEKKAADDFAATEQQRKVDAFVLEDLKRGLNENSMLGDGARSVEDLNTSFTEMFENNPLMMESYSRQAGVGGNRLGEMQKGFYSEVQAPQMQKVMELIATGSFDAETLKRVYPNVDPAFIDDAVAKAIKTEAQRDKEFNQADIIFNEGRITFNNKQVVFNSEQEAAILSAAQLVKDRSFTNTSNEMTLDAAREAVTRLVIEQAQKDIVFGREGITFRRDIQADILKAADLVITRAATNAESAYDLGQKKVVDAQELKVFDQNQAKQPAIDLQSAKKDIDANYTTATIETVTADLSRWGLTDPAIITQTWDQVRKKQEVFDLTGMTTHNNAIKQKLMKATTTNQKRVADFKQLTNSTLLDNFVGLPDKYKPEINNVAQRYIIDSSIAQEMRVFVDNEIQSGAWENANPIQITAALNGWLESINVPTYSSQMAQLQANSRSLAGVTQYTPIRFKEVYMGEFQTDAQYFIDQMNNASQSDNLAGYTTAKASLAILLNETQQDLSARKKDPQKAFGMRASQAEMSAVTTELDQLIRTMIDSSKEIEAPVKKVEVDKELRYDPSLFTPDFGSNSRIKTIDDAVNYLDAQTSTSFYGERDDLVNLQEEFRNLAKSHEESKVELSKTNVANEQLRLDEIIKKNLIRLNKITFEVKKIMRKVIKDSENFQDDQTSVLQYSFPNDLISETGVPNVFTFCKSG